jgi:hypothetical protein
MEKELNLIVIMNFILNALNLGSNKLILAHVAEKMFE